MSRLHYFFLLTYLFTFRLPDEVPMFPNNVFSFDLRSIVVVVLSYFSYYLCVY